MQKTTRQKERKVKKTAETKYLTLNHLDKIGEIPVYYGFTPYESPEIKKIDLDHAKSLIEGDYVDDENTHIHLPLHVEEKIALLRMYNENNLYSLPQPVMLYFREPFKTKKQNSAKKSLGFYPRYCDLEIMGGSRSIAEALLIQTSRTILKEEGYTDICVEINSIGDRDSINRFTRDLTNYYRRNINDIHSECRQLLKKDPFELLSCKNEKCKKINEGAPHSMDFLSESSRNHFQEVLEHLEALGILYNINNKLIGNRKYCTETIFAITTGSKESRTLAIGVRYDSLSRKIGYKKEIQGVGISLLINNNKSDLRKEVKKIKKPFASFVQLGFESKLLSLSIIESLRQVKIPLCLSLARDRLGAQVSAIGKNPIPYSIIMGKKEAMESTVIVRNVETHSQDIIPIKDLPTYMKKLEK